LGLALPPAGLAQAFAPNGAASNQTFCPSVLPVKKFSIVQSGLDTPQQLLRFELHFGSQSR
jgi:hypothetical protein